MSEVFVLTPYDHSAKLLEHTNQVNSAGIALRGFMKYSKIFN